MSADGTTEVTEQPSLRVFINYRRGPSTPYARQLYERLSQRFGVENVFWDIDTIQPGVDFVDFLRRAVGSCQVMVSVIGPGWLEASDRDGRRRLDSPEDFVRVEIEAALDRSIRIIPVLVGDANVPRSTDLPDTLAPLVRRNAMEITDTRWDYDLGRLMRALDKVAEDEQKRQLEEAAAAGAEAERKQVDEERAAAEAKAAADAEAQRKRHEEEVAAAAALAAAEAERKRVEDAQPSEAARREEETRTATEAERTRQEEEEAAAAALAAEAERKRTEQEAERSRLEEQAAAERAARERAAQQAAQETERQRIAQLAAVEAERARAEEQADAAAAAEAERKRAEEAAQAAAAAEAEAERKRVAEEERDKAQAGTTTGTGLPVRKIALIAVPAIVVLAVAGFLVFGGGGPPTTSPSATVSPTGSASSTGLPPGFPEITWSRITDDALTAPDSGKFNRVAFNGDLVAAVGNADNDAAVWTSTDDGASWTPIDDPILGGSGGQEMNMIVPVGEGFVAVGTDGQEAGVWRSSDGVTAEKVTDDALGGPGTQVMNRVVTISDIELVAAGFERPESGPDVAAVWRSIDAGATWERLPTVDAFRSDPGAHMRSITITGDGLVVGGGFDGHDNGVGAVVWTSPNLQTWTRIPAEVDGDPFGGDNGQEVATVLPGGPGVVAVGEDQSSGESDAAVWTTTDGSTWTRVDDPDLTGPGDQFMIYAIQTQSGLIAVGSDDRSGDDDGAVWVSEDGTDWVQLSDPTFGGLGDQVIRGLACQDGTIIAVGRESGDLALWKGEGVTC